MAEEPEEPSDGMTQPSREKPQWVRLLPGFLLVLVGSLPWLSTVLPQWGTMLWQWGKSLRQWCLGSWQWVLFLLWLLPGFLFLLVESWPWLSTVLPQWGKKLSQKRKAAGRWCKEWMGRLPLFAAIAIWAVLGIIAFLLAMWWLGRVPFWQLKLDPRKQAENIVKIALTLVGGVGAVAYLVIKYQERQQAGRAEKREKDRTVDTKMQDAINQLGSDKASTRIAGVYALTDIADRYKDSYRQRVVDILCGYLRSDRETYPLGEDGKPATGLPRSGDADKAVESTILSMFVAHLKKGSRDENGDVTLRRQVRNDQLWCDCSFDLHGATFHENVSLIDTTFEHGLNFQGTKFERGAHFSGAHFTGGADFSGADFTVDAHFNGAHFTGDANFIEADFTGGTNFNGATFAGGAYFGGATFAGGAYFNGATFTDNADFHETYFAGDANFGEADFAGDAHFNGTTFAGGAYFGGATFTRGAYADFSWAEFRASATFSRIPEIQGQPSFGFEACKFNKRFRGAYEWGSIPIPEDNDGLPADAVWKDFQEEDDKDGGTTNRQSAASPAVSPSGKEHM